MPHDIMLQHKQTNTHICVHIYVYIYMHTRWQCTKIPSLVNGRCFHSLMSLLVAFCYRSWISKCQTVLQISVTDEKIRVLYKSTVDRCWDVQYCREGSGGNMSSQMREHSSSTLVAGWGGKSWALSHVGDVAAQAVLVKPPMLACIEWLLMAATILGRTSTQYLKSF